MRGNNKSMRRIKPASAVEMQRQSMMETPPNVL